MLAIQLLGKGQFQLDVVSLFPSDTWDNGKSVFRADIMQNLKEYAPDFIRFPGGCIVHGVNEATMYHWKKTIGPIENRPGQWSKWRLTTVQMELVIMSFTNCANIWEQMLCT